MAKSEAKMAKVISDSDDFNNARGSIHPSIITSCSNFTGLAMRVARFNCLYYVFISFLYNQAFRLLN